MLRLERIAAGCHLGFPRLPTSNCIVHVLCRAAKKNQVWFWPSSSRGRGGGGGEAAAIVSAL